MAMCAWTLQQRESWEYGFVKFFRSLDLGSACSVAWGHGQSLTSEGVSRYMLGSLPAATNGSALPLPSEVAYFLNPTAW